MVTQIILYRGNSIRDVQPVVSTTNPRLIKSFAKAYLDTVPTVRGDKAMEALAQGRREAIKAIIGEAD